MISLVQIDFLPKAIAHTSFCLFQLSRFWSKPICPDEFSGPDLSDNREVIDVKLYEQYDFVQN